ncbi:hypothetical protein [Salinibacter ruber]|uniref:Uncharacterized protein n=1 Tax=Salinibacter ruber TaxID=146919 RepID=A0A9X2UMB9_9BACT|nr:hypothetical protein [Salinibacter ruber]MBB4089457.1 hypothetical protein [Salinibacter ruber]MCS3616052.1 hypothetical protein [Salinibacter ruber]MCS3675060.1 hypothetical protein [Salinibacter ruber]MCS3785120.1 hypothetical protein [Salinibacter ruber]MCS4037290.1 hypothetical protein [Salinibacter ruber]
MGPAYARLPTETVREAINARVRRVGDVWEYDGEIELNLFGHGG